MVILMKQGSSKTQIGQVLTELRQAGLRPRIIASNPRTILGVVEEMEKHLFGQMTRTISGMDGVDSIDAFGDSWKLVARDFHDGDTVIRIKNVAIGGGNVAVAGGPCAVESREGLIEAAKGVAAAGGDFIRAGAFKPRTSPYSFRGLKEEGLQYLAEASQTTGLPFITEVLDAADVDLVARYADVLQIGTRNMQNFALLEAVGDLDKPVLLKRGLMATVKELLLSAEYIHAKGNPQVILCERGIRTFEPETRNTLDISAVPLLKQRSHLPVVVDPSHAAGKRELVPAMALAAVAAGADGLLIEVHPRPDEALSDGRQTIDLDTFAKLMKRIPAVVQACRE